MRVNEHPVLGNVEDQKKVNFYFNGKHYIAYEGDTIASALLASGVRTLRKQEDKASPRGIYCNIGHCFECRVIIDGERTVRACLTSVEENMRIASNATLSPTFLKGGSV
ncbi:(2Fe-2S)-binding protein [Priestia filamentosa]|uniref:(2Fe-2S)-binding protein n=1 Tax=Priestia filamentosa TaxID=1402861 RepID=UPI0038575AD8